MSNTLPTDPIATALLKTVDLLTAQFDAQIRAAFERTLCAYALEDGMGFSRTGRYSAVAMESMRFSASHRYGTGENIGCVIYSAEIDGDRVARVARAAAVENLLQCHRKLLRKLGAVDACTLLSACGMTMNLEATRAGRTILLRQQVVFKTSDRGRHFCQFPARMYVDGQFTPEAAVKAMFA